MRVKRPTGSNVGVEASTHLIFVLSSFFFPISRRPSTREPVQKLPSRRHRAVKTRASGFCMYTKNNALRGEEKRLISWDNIIQ